ncbi:MAG: hypothetical protein ACOWWH_04420 [Eubacteriaceae bacterium]
MEVITFFGGGIIGTFIGYFIKHWLDIRAAKKLDEMNRKRKVYEQMIEAMNVFIGGRNPSRGMKDQLISSYSQLWLWASDDVVTNVSKHLEDQITATKKPSSIFEDKLKDSYVLAVISMRKDVGYELTEVGRRNYQFVSFD